MAKEYTVKSFKSGNSVAFRLPKALGIEASEDMVMVAHDPDTISIWKKRDAKNVFMRLYGSMSSGFTGLDDFVYIRSAPVCIYIEYMGVDHGSGI